jgi:hypothetical protein
MRKTKRSLDFAAVEPGVIEQAKGQSDHDGKDHAT